MGAEDSEQGRGGHWTRTVTEEEAGHLRVDVQAVEVVFVLQAVVLQGVGDVQGQTFARGAANKHWHHEVALSGRRKTWRRGVGGRTSFLPHTPPLPARLTLTRGNPIVIFLKTLL